MFLHTSTLAVALVIALSAAAATTQVFAADEEDDLRAVEGTAQPLQMREASPALPEAAPLPKAKAI